MINLRSILRWFGFRPVPHPPARLTHAEAAAIAREAIAKIRAHVGDETYPLIVQHVRQTEVGIEWLISTGTIGSGVFARIDDASGGILECDSWGVR